MRRKIVSLFLAFAAASCSVDIPEGLFGCQQNAECPSAWYCRKDGRCYSSPDPDGKDAAIAMPGEDARTSADDAMPRDATPGEDAATDQDAIPGDAPSTTEDAAIDASTSEDARPNEDATPDFDDAALTTADAGSCSPLAGQPCSRPDRCGSTYDCAGECAGGTAPRSCACGTAMCTGGSWQCPDPADLGAACDTANRCGARIDCSGQCAGGTAPPRCGCGPATCGANGQWSACPGPPNVGTLCTGATDRCGDRVDCAGNCTGGTPQPMCPCAPATCQANGQWSACAVPADYQSACSTAQVCGGRVDCAGQCSGGAPPPACPQCGTPTCNGCVGGPACSSAAAACTPGGQCQCVVDDCDCGAAGTSCTRCIGGQVGICSVDTYGCGVFAASGICAFGCSTTAPELCGCSPDQGTVCVHSICPCTCGDFERYGLTQCDGSCSAPTVTCPLVCRRECGRDPPEPL